MTEDTTMSLKIERPGDVFAPKTGGLAEARKRADTADELGSQRDGLRWRQPREILVDNREQGPGQPEDAEVVAGIQAVDGVLLKTSIGESVVVTEWRHHPDPMPTCYHVFEVRRMDETERTFSVERDAEALAYHATLEAAIRRRRQTDQEIRRLRKDGQTIGELLRDFSATEVVDALGVLPVADALDVSSTADQLTEPRKVL